MFSKVVVRRFKWRPKFKRSYTGGVTATDVKIHIASDPSQTYFIQADATVTASAGFGFGILNGVLYCGNW